MLRELFDRLAMPSGASDFAAERIAGWNNYRIARNRAGQAALLIAHQMEAGGVAPADLELRHVAFLSAAECQITSSEGTESGIFAVVRWKTSDGPLQDLFLEVLGSWIGTLGHSPNISTIRSGFDRLAQVFADLERPAIREVIGLWGELLVIACANDPEVLLRGWHVDPYELHDFQAGLDLLEVKTTIAPLRRHDFTLAQLSPPSGTRLVVASMMLSSHGGTLSILDLAQVVKARFANPELKLRVDLAVISAMGDVLQDTVSYRFNPHASASTLRFFDGSRIPCVSRVLPAEVSDVRFKVELDGLAHLSDSALQSISPFHAASRPSLRPERWNVYERS